MSELRCIKCNALCVAAVTCRSCSDKQKAEIDRLMEQATNDKRLIEELEKILREIKDWANAYPIEVFPKPDLQKAAKVLKEAGMTLDSISADAMRHVLEGIKDKVEQALKENQNNSAGT